MGSECSTDKCSKRKERPKKPVVTQVLEPAPRPPEPVQSDKPRSWQSEKFAYEAQRKLQVTETREVTKEKLNPEIRGTASAIWKKPERSELNIIDESLSEDLATFRMPDDDEHQAPDALVLPENYHESSDEDPPPMPNQPRDAVIPSRAANPRANLLPKFNEVAK